MALTADKLATFRINREQGNISGISSRQTKADSYRKERAIFLHNNNNNLFNWIIYILLFYVREVSFILFFVIISGSFIFKFLRLFYFFYLSLFMKWFCDSSHDITDIADNG